MTDRINRFDNTNTVRKVLEGTELSDESIELILNTLNEMQIKLDKQVNTKLESYVSNNDMNDLQGEFKVLDRKL